MDDEAFTGLRRLQGILKDKKLDFNVEEFLEKMSMHDLIYPRDKRETMAKNRDNERIDAAFVILLQQDPRPTFKKVKQILSEMKMDNVLKKLEAALRVSKTVFDIILGGSNVERFQESNILGAPEPNGSGFTGCKKQFQKLLKTRNVVACIVLLIAVGTYSMDLREFLVSVLAFVSNAESKGEKILSQKQRIENLKWWNIIRANRLVLRDEYNVDGKELLRNLSDKNVFTPPEEKQIRSKDDPRELYDELFEILFHKDGNKYVSIFLNTLTAIGRQDAREFLLTQAKVTSE
ncbi:unnamed protein product [Darwinula stevensoni]|uniref:CARD domain-containing protein n=1 Tax=Darwinula stevensoni TaxID=69355 RepID=A0A7R8XC12_9CRUS|nr:unnamed protein product [Darwinula stevensoni]CAG0892906.1 unnamed protein product [Darwinula stevensoni]